MATCVIGDIHGCFATMQRLLGQIRWDPAADKLWLVGDLVNRGPASLEVLRWAVAHDESVTAVLGNHDLHLLARAAGLAAATAGDTLDEVLAAPDRGELLDWLRRRPFIHRRGERLLVHAGLLPGWDLECALALGAAAAERLRGESWKSFLAGALDERHWDDERTGEGEVAAAVAVFTLLRTVDDAGRPRFAYTGPPETAPEGWRPWYQAARALDEGVHVFFGHWAALGLRRAATATCLDSGCVYGNRLSALRLEDGRLFQQEICEPATTIGD